MLGFGHSTALLDARSCGTQQPCTCVLEMQGITFVLGARELSSVLGVGLIQVRLAACGAQARVSCSVRTLCRQVNQPCGKCTALRDAHVSRSRPQSSVTWTLEI